MHDRQADPTITCDVSNSSLFLKRRPETCLRVEIKLFTYETLVLYLSADKLRAKKIVSNFHAVQLSKISCASLSINLYFD